MVAEFKLRERSSFLKLKSMTFSKDRTIEVNCEVQTMWLGVIHKGRPHPRGEGGLVKSGHMRTQGGGGVSGKKRTSANSNFYQNFRSLDSVLCARIQHLTQQQIT